MTPAKRGGDILLALVLGLLALPLGVAIAVAILWRDGRPVLHASERMQTPERAFAMLKFRTMKPAPADAGVTGGDKAGRITATGALLRRLHLDELPQLWNVLRGDMSMVGPRPPLRHYVQTYPALYARVLRSRPGLTGLATLRCGAREARLLGRCRSAAETEAVYLRACIPVKARLDLMYQANRSLCWDAVLLWQTLTRRRR
ncbi:sugar transferase [Roseovarius spongiae]|uniref:Sugar transferase n=1 Tax=Roseovarius spongiae TaxID=2320272 RepID=A0A3A8B4M7_9RHOB|nr:sugar transferase [Roseovarius spongiae]RKF16721.1 sugar transferase [Roseovarius spongiae]